MIKFSDSTEFISCPVLILGRGGTLTPCHRSFKTSMKQNHPCGNLLSLMLNRSLPDYSFSISHIKFLRGITLPLLILSCPFLVKYFTENNWNLMMLHRTLYKQEKKIGRNVMFETILSFHRILRHPMGTVRATNQLIF